MGQCTFVDLWVCVCAFVHLCVSLDVWMCACVYVCGCGYVCLFEFQGNWGCSGMGKPFVIKYRYNRM